MYGAIVAEFRAYVKWICENCCILPDRSDAKKAENAHTDEHDRRQYQNNMRPKRYASFVDAISRKFRIDKYGVHLPCREQLLAFALGIESEALLFDHFAVHGIPKHREIPVPISVAARTQSAILNKSIKNGQ